MTGIVRIQFFFPASIDRSTNLSGFRVHRSVHGGVVLEVECSHSGASRGNSLLKSSCFLRWRRRHHDPLMPTSRGASTPSRLEYSPIAGSNAEKKTSWSTTRKPSEIWRYRQSLPRLWNRSRKSVSQRSFCWIGCRPRSWATISTVLQKPEKVDQSRCKALPESFHSLLAGDLRRCGVIKASTSKSIIRTPHRALAGERH